MELFDMKLIQITGANPGYDEFLDSPDRVVSEYINRSSWVHLLGLENWILVHSISKLNSFFTIFSWFYIFSLMLKNY